MWCGYWAFAPVFVLVFFVRSYIHYGMVVIVNPRTKTVTVYTSATQVARLTEADTLDGGDVVPGFSYPIERLFS